MQLNRPTCHYWTVFDVDHAAATLSWDDVGAQLQILPSRPRPTARHI
ncbi:replication initiation protein [Enterobacter kobei]